MQCWNEFDHEIFPNGTIHCIHAQILQYWSKWDDLGIFGKVRSRGETFMVNTFTFESLIMMNFEAEVCKFQHVKFFSKCQVIYLNIPTCLTFYVSFKWDNFFIKVVYISNTFKMITNFMSFGFRMIELCIFEVEENHLFNGIGQKWPIMFQHRKWFSKKNYL